MKKVSIVIPVYNEQANIGLIYQVILMQFNTLISYDFQILFIDDGSRDNSWTVIQDLIMHDDRVEGISFSRNFGYQMALTAGYDYAKGDAVIVMDCDLQHPPDLIPAMIRKWEEGFEIVYGRRAYREERLMRKITGGLYYKLLSKVSDVALPGDVSDFCLIDKKVHDVVKKCREREPFMRGIVAWCGFSHTFVDYNPVARMQGTSTYNWTKLIKLAFDGLTSLSRFPLEIAAYIGSFVIVTGFLMFGYIAVDAFINHARYPLFKWLTVVLYSNRSTILFNVAFGRVYWQDSYTIKERPLYVVKSYLKQDVIIGSFRQLEAKKYKDL